MRWLPYVLCLAACTERHLVGQLPEPDAGVDPVIALGEAIVGRWCGQANLSPWSDDPEDEVSLELEFRSDGIVCFECDCDEALGRFLPDTCEGRYRITDVTFDGYGWGRARGPLPGGETALLGLDRIRIEEDERLDFEISFEEISFENTSFGEYREGILLEDVPLGFRLKVPLELEACPESSPRTSRRAPHRRLRSSR